MKELVDYLFKHYHPGGNTCRVILINKLVKEGPFTREQIYRMACLAHKADLMMLEYNSKNGLEMFFKPYQVQALNHLQTTHPLFYAFSLLHFLLKNQICVCGVFLERNN